MVVEGLGGCSPAERLAWSGVECERDGGEFVGAVAAEVGALREVLAEQPVGVLVAAALPGAVGVAEVDVDAGVDPQLCMLGHLRALIPGQRPAQLLGQRQDGGGDRIAGGFGAVPGDPRPASA